MANIKDFMKLLANHLLDDDKDRKVEKSIPIRAEWLPLCDEMTKLQEQIKEKQKEMKSLVFEMVTKKQKFWATVESDLGIYDRQMHLNHKTKEVEIYAEEKDEEDED